MIGAPNTSSPKFQTSDTQSSKSIFSRGLIIVCAVGISSALLIGYAYLRWRHAERLRAKVAAASPIQKPNPSPQAKAFVDEAMIKGSQAVIGGTVQNISPDKLTSVTVEIELKRRKDGKSEVRTLTIDPSDLESQQQGRYALNVSSHEYRESRLQSVKAGTTPADIPFKILPGASRPDERLPTNVTITAKPSPRRGKGEEFINTPDNPVRVP